MSSDSSAAAAASPAIPLDRAVEKYLALRDKLAAIKKQQAEANKPYVEAMDRLETILLDALNNANLNAMRAPAGTFFKTTETSVKVHEWSKTLAHIQEHELWELLEARVNKTAAQAIIEETRVPIPGVAVERLTVVQVRRA